MSESSTNPVTLAGIERAGRAVLSPIEENVAQVERLWLLYVSDERYRTVQALARRSGVPGKRITPLLPVFRERLVQETERYRKTAEPYLQARTAALVDAMVDRLSDIITNGKDSDAVAAIKVARDIIRPTDGMTAQVSIQNAQVLVQAAQGVASVEDIRRIVAAGVNGNVEAVEAQSASRANRVRER